MQCAQPRQRNLITAAIIDGRQLRAACPAEWLPADALDSTYFRLLPSGQRTVTAEEAAMLAVIFAEDGELPARPASGFAN
jgi:hypothetical protein